MAPNVRPLTDSDTDVLDVRDLQPRDTGYDSLMPRLTTPRDYEEDFSMDRRPRGMVTFRRRTGAGGVLEDFDSPVDSSPDRRHNVYYEPRPDPAYFAYFAPEV